MTATMTIEQENILSDEALVSLCTTQLPDNTEAFAELWRRYNGEISGFCQRFLRDANNAADVCQAVFMQVFRRIKRFEFRSSFKTWLYTVARNACLSFYRANSRHHFVDELPVDELVCEQQQANLELSLDVQNALAVLSQEQRQVLLLLYDLGLSLEEIAEQLALGLSATKMRLYRAQTALRHNLESAGFSA